MNLHEWNEDGLDTLTTNTTSTAVHLESKNDAAHDELCDEIPMTFPQKVITFHFDNEAPSCLMNRVIGDEASIVAGLDLLARFNVNVVFCLDQHQLRVSQKGF